MKLKSTYDHLQIVDLKVPPCDRSDDEIIMEIIGYLDRADIRLIELCSHLDNLDGSCLYRYVSLLLSGDIPMARIKDAFEHSDYGFLMISEPRTDRTVFGDKDSVVFLDKVNGSWIVSLEPVKAYN